MKIQQFDTVEEMLDLKSLSAITDKTIAKFERSPFENEGFSGNSLEKITVFRSDGQSHSYVLKHFDITGDWLMRLTHDDTVREVALYLQNIYQKLPDECVVPILAVAKKNNSWATLMVDVSDDLVPSGDDQVPSEDIKRHMDHLAKIHASFMSAESFKDPKFGLCSELDWITMLSPEVGHNEVAAGTANDISGMLESAWENFYEVFPPKAVQIIKELQEDIAPLLNELKKGPYTFLHGDYKYANIGSTNDPTPKTIMLDWGMAMYGSPLLDVAWFLAINSAKLSISKEEVLSSYRNSLATYGYTFKDPDWARFVTLGIVSNMLRLGWAKSLGANAEDPDVKAREMAEVKWWAEQIEKY